MTRLLVPALSLALLGLAACGDNETAAVEATPNAAPTEVSETRADTAASAAALALGLSRAQLEDADLVGPAPDHTDFGDVEILVLDASGQVTGLVIDLEGMDKDVVVPIADVTSLRRGAEIDLTTAMTQAQLQALPAYTGPGA